MLFGALVLVATCLVTTGCGSHAEHKAAPAKAPASNTVWLCRPGLQGDPCTRSLATTSVAADGARRTLAVQPATGSRFDCFYVYPTVSNQKTANANLHIDQVEVDAAVEQASQFSRVCRVWAPIYRQQTVAGLLDITGYKQATDIAFKSLLAGWRDYLAHDNHGRPFVLIGHSQGAAMLIRLIRSQIDTNPVLRRQLVSAIVLGGNVQVPVGKVVGGSFQHVPGCTAADQTGCVIAYSSFPGRPPTFTLFGRPGTGVSLLSGQTATTGRVLCVNPAALGGGPGPLEPYFTKAVLGPPGPPVATHWVTYPGLYTAACKSSGGDTWLQVNDIGAAADKRPRVTEQDGASWGFHVADVNLALGNLVEAVQGQEAAFRTAQK